MTNSEVLQRALMRDVLARAAEALNDAAILLPADASKEIQRLNALAHECRVAKA